MAVYQQRCETSIVWRGNDVFKNGDVPEPEFAGSMVYPIKDCNSYFIYVHV
jgi:hypothetical protein